MVGWRKGRGALLVGLVLWGAGLTACTEAVAPMDPVARAQQQVLHSFYAAAANAEVEQALGHWAQEAVASALEAQVLQGNLRMLVALQQEKIQANGGLAAVRLLESGAAGQEGQQPPEKLPVTVRLEFNNGSSLTEALHLVQAGDGWKITL